MTTGDRLSEERGRLSYTQTEFGEVGGVTKATQINYEKGRQSPSADYLAAIAAQGADVLYIVTGQRSALDVSEVEKIILSQFRAVPQQDKDVVLRVLDLAFLDTGRKHKA